MKHIIRDRRGSATRAGLYLVIASVAVVLVLLQGSTLGLPDFSWMVVGGVAVLGFPMWMRLGRAKSQAAPLPSTGTSKAKGPPSIRGAKAHGRPSSGGPKATPPRTEGARPVSSGPGAGGRGSVAGASGSGATPPAEPISQARKAAAESRAVLVLPMTIGGSDPSIDYLAEGLAEAVLLGLAALKGARVPARDSAFSFKFKDVETADAGRQIGAGFVLEGRVGKNGEQLTVSAQLIHASNGRVVWFRTLEGTLDDVCEMEEELIRAVAETLKLPAPSGGWTLSSGRRTRSGDAQTAYLQGRYARNRHGEGFQRAAPWFEQAVRADDGFGLALAGRADNEVQQGFYGYVEPRSSLQRARASAEAALTIDDTLPEAWSALGCARMLRDWDWSGAEDAFRRAVAINPVVVQARFWAGMHRGLCGHPVDWIRHCVMGLRMDPRSVVAHCNVGWALLGARIYGKAQELLDQAIQLNPEFGFAYWLRGRARAYGGDVEGGLADLIESAKRTKVNPIAVSSLGYMVARSGKTARAERHLNDLVAGPAGWRWVLPTQLATIKLGLGRHEEALGDLRQALEARDVWLPLTLRRPEWDALRAETAFQDVLRGAGLGEVPASRFEQARKATGG